MAASLKEVLDKNYNKNKIRIGYTDGLSLYTSLFEKKKSPKNTEKKKVLGEASTNALTEVDLSGVEENGFISDEKLKQGVLSLEVYGAVPIIDSQNVYLGAPKCTAVMPGGNGGKVSSFAQCCPLTSSPSEITGGDYFVGILLDIPSFGESYLKRFYPNTQMHAESNGVGGPPSLMDYMEKGQLWAEIVIPSSSNSASSGKAFNCKVLGASRNTPSAMYISSPICCLDMFSPCFPVKSLSNGETFTPLYKTNKYNAYNAKIEGFNSDDISKKMQASTDPATREIVITPSSSRCRIRLWIDKNATNAAGVPSELFQRNYNRAEISEVVSSSDGAPININANPSAHVEVAIDIGHTSDGERKHPNETSADWLTGDSGKVAQIMGFNKDTDDSVEHMYNTRIGQFLSDVLNSRGISAGVFDYPKMSNRDDINQSIKDMLSCSPKITISIHQNAEGDNSAYTQNLRGTARGTLVEYSNSNAAKLSADIANSVNGYRETSGQPKTIEKTTLQTSQWAIIREPSKYCISCLIEVGFYDNISELVWMAEHPREIAEKIAEPIINYLKQNA